MSDVINNKAPSGNESVAAASVEIPSYLPRQTLSQLLRNDLGFLPILLTLVVIMIFFGIVTGGQFFNPDNLTNLALQIATISVDALGVTLVLLLGEIDLSVASVGTLGAVVMAILAERMKLPGWEAVTFGLLTGALVGCINGVFIAVLRVPAFIVTLAASIGYEGLLLSLLYPQATLIIRDPLIVLFAGTSRSYLPSLYGIGIPTLLLLVYIGASLYDRRNRARAGLKVPPLWQLIVQIIAVAVVVEGVIVLFENNLGVPISTSILFGLILIFWILLRRTPFGRHLYAVGGNSEATRRAGINVTAIRVLVFTLCSTLAVVGGILAASRQTAVASQIDPTLLLQSIAAAVIGGVSLFGGRGSVWSVILGALIIGSLANGLALLNSTQAVQEMIEGIVLLLAVTVDALVRRAQKRSGR